MSKPVTKPEPLALMAMKALLLAPVSAGAKAVGGVLLDHLNWRTNRCDPGNERIANLAGCRRSTVQAAINSLQRNGLIAVRLHGGVGGTNQYDFKWDEIRWRDQVRRARHSGRHPPEKPVLAGPNVRAQTRPINPNKEPVAVESFDTRRSRLGCVSEGQAGRLSTAPRSVQSLDREEAARQAALRRWSGALLHRFKSHPILYGKIVDAIDDVIREKVTEAELRKQWSGLPSLLEQLKASAIGVEVAAVSATEAGGGS